ncbi:transglutaminase-like domain-containing protein [Parendozoicomonas haliclonae]|uniref:Transglutaminase-like superfamily protein n=1 Tax=Parendozoicomonas haliclonae TaxID=1960125 RepID=A0A1X7AMY6_9GAMM|nr:transglutaminase family protein [Parendozoicomonas haliclonae]SMA49635.1 Transglutaminase-like superfamily protein [Parendozoicomonas haliclonae]
MQQYLCPTPFFNYEHPAIQAWVHGIVGQEQDPVQQAVRLYKATRDDIRYNPYSFKLQPESLSASYCLETGESYCIPKAVLLGAACRSLGIPARLGLANVKNHISSPQLIEYLRSEVFVMHGFIELYLEGQWVKATPAFNAQLCRHMGVEPLEFNGREDSIFHEYSTDGSRHMEYLADHGTFDDVPFDFIVKSIAEAYPHLMKDKLPENHSLEEDLNLQEIAG